MVSPAAQTLGSFDPATSGVIWGGHRGAELDRREYPSGGAVTNTQMAAIQLKPHAFHGEWNYTIRPVVHRR